MKKNIIILTLALSVIFTAVALSTCSSGPSAIKGSSKPQFIADLRISDVYVSDETIGNIYNDLSKNLQDGLSIALIPVYPSPGIEKGMADLITELLEVQFVNSDKYNMLERARINHIIAEQNFQAEYTSNESAVQLGKLLGADAVLIGNVDGRDVNQRIVMRALEVNTGRILAMVMEQFEWERGFSEIAVFSSGTNRVRLTNREYGIQTEILRLEPDSQTLFKVPNGQWEITCDFRDGASTVQRQSSILSVELMTDTRLYLKAYRPKGRDSDIAEEERREQISAAAKASADRVAFAKGAAQKLANELQGKIQAQAGTAFFPLTGKSISADNANFFFDVMLIELANSGGMNIIEKQKLAALLDEYDFQMSGMAGVRTIGQLLGADLVIFGIAGERTIELMAVDVARFTTLADITHSY